MPLFFFSPVRQVTIYGNLFLDTLTIHSRPYISGMERQVITQNDGTGSFFEIILVLQSAYDFNNCLTHTGCVRKNYTIWY